VKRIYNGVRLFDPIVKGCAGNFVKIIPVPLKNENRLAPDLISKRPFTSVEWR
jgi:hypothetical protein